MYSNGQGADMTKRRDVLALGILGATALLAHPRPASGTENGMPQAIGSALLDKYVAAVNAHDTSSFGEIHTESYIQHSGRSPNGLAAQIENFRGIFSRMPDVEMRVEDRIIAGDKVVARMTFSATHTQPLLGIAPTGRRFTLRTIDIWRVENGKFAEHWDIVDYAGLQKQLRGD
jgi:predicted ester cyclase